MGPSVDLKNIVETLVYGSQNQTFCTICLMPLKDKYEDAFTRVCNKDMEFSVAEVLNIFGIKLPITEWTKICHPCIKLASAVYNFYTLSQRSQKMFDVFVKLLNDQISMNHSGNHAFLIVPDTSDLDGNLSDKIHIVNKKVASLFSKEKKDEPKTKKRRWTRKPITPTSCTRCPVKYRMLAKLKDHMRTDHGIEIHICQICKACIEDDQEFENHLKTHTDIFICDKCNVAFKQRNAIMKHLKWHEDIKNLINSDQGNICEICGLVFENEGSLAEHKEDKHVKNYTCYYCGRMFKIESGFEAHIRKHELYMTKNKSKLKVLEEERPKNVTCSKCGKSFKHKRSLISHERLHTNDRPFICTTCGRGFVTSNRRNQHALCAHTAPARRCPLCPALFHLRSMVNSHIKKVHLNKNKRRQRSPRVQNVYWKTKTVPIQELGVDIQDDVFNLEDGNSVNCFEY